MIIEDIIKAIKKIEDDCAYGANQMEYSKFYERVKGLLNLLEATSDKPRTDGGSKQTA